MKKQTNIAIVAPDILPIPAIKGGAIETIVENIVKQNDIYKEIDITVYTIYDKEAVKLSKVYKDTKFVFIRNNNMKSKVYNFIEKILRRLIGINIKPYYIKSVLKDINRKYFDELIVEGDKKNIDYLKNNKLGLKPYLHIHHDALKENSNNIINNSKKIIVVSEYIKQQTILNNKCEKSNIVVLKNSIDTTLFNKDKYREESIYIRDKYKIKESDIVISFTGRLIPEKGVKELILAFKEIKNRSNVKLLIIGSSNFGLQNKSEYERELEELIEDIKDNIIFTGFVHNSEIPKIHSIVDIAVVPSTCNEAAGIVVIEATSSGIPLIATKSGGIPEYVNKDSSILINNDENIIESLLKAMQMFIDDSKLRNKMSEKSREKIEVYDNKIYYKNFVKILKEEEGNKV